MLKFALSLVVLVLLFTVLLRLFENHFVFYPSRYTPGRWQQERLALHAEDCFFKTSDGLTLHGWFVPREAASGTLLWCHGNAGNLADRFDNLLRLSELPVNVFIFDYRGYGRSEGSPSENGIYLDAEAAYDYLRSRGVRSEELIIFGRSLGGAVAVDLASTHPAAGLILESTFTRAKDMAKASFGVLPVHWFMKTELNSVAKISRVTVPLLMIHGNADRVVPFHLGRKLFEAANEPKTFFEIAGADHNDTYLVGGANYVARLRAFMEMCLRTPTPDRQ